MKSGFVRFFAPLPGDRPNLQAVRSRGIEFYKPVLCQCLVVSSELSSAVSLPRSLFVTEEQVSRKSERMALTGARESMLYII
jgi:hypothetical protein